MIENSAIERMAGRVAFSVMTAKDRPDDLFAGKFWDIREKTKALKEKWSKEVQEELSKTLINDLKSKGVALATLPDGSQDFNLSLGQYRGSKFVTSAKFKVKLKDKKSAEKLLTYLQKRYSPKYKLKNVAEEKGGVIASYNIR